jgi:chorismate mutase
MEMMMLYRQYRRLAGVWLLLYIGACGLFLTACQTAPAVLPDAQRQAVDTLLRLMDQRLLVASEVAQAKWNSAAPIDDPLRERQILDDLTAQLPHDDADWKLLVRGFFQAQFDAGKIIQRTLHAQWHQEQHARFVNPPDLARDIRPQLDRLTPQLLVALAQLRPFLASPAVRAYIRQRAPALLAVKAANSVRETALSGLPGLL